MTNGEKYKTARERAEAFDRFCKSNTTDEGLCMPDCKLFHAQDDSKCYCGHCEFRWLDLEADDENPLPCPFCGGECAINGSGRVYQVACKAFCGYVSMKKETESDSIADHNRVAKKCMEVKE